MYYTLAVSILGEYIRPANLARSAKNDTYRRIGPCRGSNDSGGVSQLDALPTGFADRSNRFNSAFEYVVSHSNLNGKASDESKKKIKIMINNFI
jgi:hypothetical protein